MPLHLVGGGAVGVAVVWRATDQQEIQRAAQRVQVGTGVTGVGVAPLFGGHVVGRAEALPIESQRSGLLCLSQERQPHVEDFDLAGLLRDKQVGGLDVAMHDAQLVSSCQSLGRLPDRFARIDHRHRALGLDELLQVLALDILHRQVMRAVDLTGVESLDNVRVLQRPDGQHLAFKPGQGIGPGEDVLRQDLQSHQLAELGMPRLIDDPHSALAQLGEQLVRTELVADIDDRIERAHRLARSGLVRGITEYGLRRRLSRRGNLHAQKHPRDDACLLGEPLDVFILSRCFTLPSAVFKFHGQQFGQQSAMRLFRSLGQKGLDTPTVPFRQLQIETVTKLVNLGELLVRQ